MSARRARRGRGRVVGVAIWEGWLGGVGVGGDVGEVVVVGVFVVANHRQRDIIYIYIVSIEPGSGK
jgi:hypothetical protein